MTPEFWISELKATIKDAETGYREGIDVGVMAWRHICVARAHREVAKKVPEAHAQLHKTADNLHMQVARKIAATHNYTEKTVTEQIAGAFQKTGEAMAQQTGAA